MSNPTSPTDWKGGAMQARIAKRYAAERRFKALGLLAVLASGAFLAFLLFVMVGNGLRGFTYTNVAVPVDFKAMPLTVDAARLGDADADQVIANAGLADIVAFAADEALVSEHSHKYTRQSFSNLAWAAGWQVEETWTDPRGWFGVLKLVPGRPGVSAISGVDRGSPAQRSPAIDTR